MWFSKKKTEWTYSLARKKKKFMLRAFVLFVTIAPFLAQSQELRWRYKTSSSMCGWTPPPPLCGMALSTSCALNTTTGTKIWSFETGWYVDSSQCGMALSTWARMITTSMHSVRARVVWFQLLCTDCGHGGHTGATRQVPALLVPPLGPPPLCRMVLSTLAVVMATSMHWLNESSKWLGCK